MIAEVLFFFLMYYAFGLLLALFFFRNEALWNSPVGENGAAAVSGVFLLNLVWPVMLLVLAFTFHPKKPRIVAVYCGERS